MSSYIDIKFLNLLSQDSQNLKENQNTYIILGVLIVAILKNLQSKARGFVYLKKNDMFFKCHNCGVGQSLGNLIKFMDPLLHKEYIFERFKDGKTVAKKEEPEFDFTPSRLLKNKPYAEFTRYDKAFMQLRRFDEVSTDTPCKTVCL